MIFRTGIKRNKPFVCQGNIAVLQKNYRNNIDGVNDNANPRINNILGATSRFLESFLGS